MAIEIVANDVGRGILSEADREFLEAGEQEYKKTRSRQAVDKRKQAIRNRLRAGMFDFKLLADPTKLDDSQLISVLESFDTRQNHSNSKISWQGYEGEIEIKWPYLAKGVLSKIIAFVYRANPDQFEEIVRTGLLSATNDLFSDATVEDVTVEIRNPDDIVERAKRKMRQKETLSDAEIRTILDQGAVDPNTLATYIQTGRLPSQSDESIERDVDTAFDDLTHEELLDLVGVDVNSANYSDEELRKMVDEDEEAIRDMLREIIEREKPVEPQVMAKETE